jgi:hypothetical protein
VGEQQGSSGIEWEVYICMDEGLINVGEQQGWSGKCTYVKLKAGEMWGSNRGGVEESGNVMENNIFGDVFSSNIPFYFLNEMRARNVSSANTNSEKLRFFYVVL